MAKATIISTVPIDIKEMKPGLIPSTYRISKAKKDSFQFITVGDAIERIYMPLSDPKTPPMRQTVVCEEVARSVVEDYIAGSVATRREYGEDGKTMAIPGIFWVPGDPEKGDIALKYKTQIEQAKKNTTAWMKNLVIIADNEWEKNRQSKLITKLQRIACAYLGLTREWNFDESDIKTSNCWNCKIPVNAEAITCNGCRAILNQAEWDKNKHRFAPV